MQPITACGIETIQKKNRYRKTCLLRRFFFVPPAAKLPDIVLMSGSFSISFRNDSKKQTHAKLLFMEGRYDSLSENFQENFRKHFQNQKLAKSFFMKGKTAAIFGNDSRESFPNRLEEKINGQI